MFFHFRLASYRQRQLRVGALQQLCSRGPGSAAAAAADYIPQVAFIVDMRSIFTWLN